MYEQQPEPDTAPRDLVIPSQNDPEPSPDFVERTWTRVLADQARIRMEAADLDETPFPAATLAAWETKEPSTNFVDRVAHVVAEEQRNRNSTFDELLRRGSPAPLVSAGFVERTTAAVTADFEERSARWQQLISKYAVPRPTGDFVARTLDALRPEPEPSKGRILQGPWLRRSLLTGVVAAAALAIGFFLLPANSASPPAPSNTVAHTTDAELERILQQLEGDTDSRIRTAAATDSLLGHAARSNSSLPGSPMALPSIDPLILQAVAAEEARSK